MRENGIDKRDRSMFIHFIHSSIISFNWIQARTPHPLHLRARFSPDHRFPAEEFNLHTRVANYLFRNERIRRCRTTMNCHRKLSCVSTCLPMTCVAIVLSLFHMKGFSHKSIKRHAIFRQQKNGTHCCERNIEYKTMIVTVSHSSLSRNGTNARAIVLNAFICGREKCFFLTQIRCVFFRNFNFISNIHVWLLVWCRFVSFVVWMHEMGNVVCMCERISFSIFIHVSRRHLIFAYIRWT